MHMIAESNVLLRAQAELPVGFRVATESWPAGWNLMRLGGVRRLERKIHTRGWNFVAVAAGKTQSGVGETAQKAIASALSHALRLVDDATNAVEVKRIELTQYPWFCLARMRVHSYRIQEHSVLPYVDDPAPLPEAARRVAPLSTTLRPVFLSAVPLPTGLAAPRAPYRTSAS